MSIQTIVKEIAVADHLMDFSVEVRCDHYRLGLRAPRIEVVFENDKDSRRMPLHANTFGPVEGSEGAVSYHTCQYNLDVVFWDCQWKDCRIFLDIEYDGETYHQVPMLSEAGNSGRKNVITMEERQILLHIPEGIDSLDRMELSPIGAILACLLHLGTAFLGILLLPWFCLDVLGMLLLGTEYVEGEVKGSFLKRYIFYVSWRYFGFGRNKNGVAGMKINLLQLAYQLFSSFTGKKKGILFLSTRRDDLTGNFECIYEHLKDDPEVRIRFWLHPEEIRNTSFVSVVSLAWKAARARVILIDDYVLFLEYMGISHKTRILQLWHACGAFKTFGFSRFGKKGGPLQESKTHRNYSYTFVSGANVAKYYAEGFGLAEKKILPYGVPRTDMFFDEEVKKQKKEELYAAYPALKDKKVILFAPTFRGNGKQTAYYEKGRFDPVKMMEHLPEDHILIIKHHPFVRLKYEIPDRHQNRIFDFSGKSEINDLLFITDLLITDYSSVVYEASLLNIPMLFYAYDLENYVATRDFYSGYEHFVPGKIVRSQEELERAIMEGNYETGDVEAFCHRNFDIRDGKASERIADFIREITVGTVLL